MKRVYGLFVLIVFSGCAFLSKSAQKAVQYLPEEAFLIKPVLNAGDKMNYHIQSVTTNTMEIQGQTQSVDVRTDMDVKMRVKEVNEGGYTLSFSIEKADGTVSTAQGMRSLPGLDKIIGKDVEIKIGKDGKVLHVGKLEDVSGVSDIARQVAELFLFIPSKTVKIGEVWTKTVEREGSKGDYTFTLKDVKLIGGKKIGRIEEKGIIKVDKKQDMMGMTADVHLSGKEKSEVSVEIAKGLPVEKKISLGLEGTSTISGGTIPGTMEMKMYIDNTVTIKMK